MTNCLNFGFHYLEKKNSNLNLYNQFMFDEYFIPMNVGFYKETTISKNIMAKLKLPFNLKDLIK